MSLFGNNSSAGGGLFGGASTTAKPAGGGLFGGASTTPASTSATTGGGLFGKTDATAKPAATGGLFGGTTTPAAATPAGGGLFGGAATTKPAETKPAATGGLFGGSTTPAATTPAAGGLFGGAATAKPAETKHAATGGLFGGTTTPAATTPAGGGLFGGAAAAKPAETKPAATGGLFGGSSTEAKPAEDKPAATGGLFGTASTTAATATTSATTPATTAAATTTGLESIFYDRMDDTLTLWDKRLKKQVAELGQYYKNMSTVDEEIEASYKMIVQLEKEQKEAEDEQQNLCIEMKALEQKQITIGNVLSELESKLGQIIDSKINNNSKESYAFLTDDHPSATLQDHFHTVTMRVEKAESRADTYQKRLASSLNNLAQMNGFSALVELLNGHQVALDGMSDQLDGLLAKRGEKEKASDNK